MKMTPLQENLQKLGKITTIGLIVCAVILLILDLILHRHGKIALEDKLFFPAVFGFAAFIVLVLIALALKAVLAREEDYYD